MSPPRESHPTTVSQNRFNNDAAPATQAAGGSNPKPNSRPATAGPAPPATSANSTGSPTSLVSKMTKPEGRQPEVALILMSTPAGNESLLRASIVLAVG